jgi:1-deoxyxylulose-5-phosphate synthase
MQHTRFGRTGLRVPRLCLGTMTFGGQCDEAQSFAIMDAAFGHGIAFFDTADMYPPFGHAGRRPTRSASNSSSTTETNDPQMQACTEEIIGRWLAARGTRDDVLLASKCFFPTGRRQWESGNSRHNVIRALDESLRRLGTDRLDLYQVHHWDTTTPIDETLQVLDDVVRAGKVRYIGCSNVMAYQLARSIGRAEVLRTVRFESVQPRYNLLFREFEREMFPLCSEEQVAVIPYNPLAGGFLSGKHSPEADTTGTRFEAGDQGARYRERYWNQRAFATIETLRPLAAESGVSLATLALQWVLANPVITSPIVGASRPEQLADAVAAVSTPIDPSVKARLDEVSHEFRFGDAVR